MNIEGHSCWEECDEGPHGCICGNDCEPRIVDHESGDPYANPLDTSTGPVKTAPDSSHIDHTNRTQEES